MYPMGIIIPFNNAVKSVDTQLSESCDESAAESVAAAAPSKSFKINEDFLLCLNKNPTPCG